LRTHSLVAVGAARMARGIEIEERELTARADLTATVLGTAAGTIVARLDQNPLVEIASWGRAPSPP
jgi:hypothetical protein